VSVEETERQKAQTSGEAPAQRRLSPLHDIWILPQAKDAIVLAPASLNLYWTSLRVLSTFSVFSLYFRPH
jgi:hypothetical protein